MGADDILIRVGLSLLVDGCPLRHCRVTLHTTSRYVWVVSDITAERFVVLREGEIER